MKMCAIYGYLASRFGPELVETFMNMGLFQQTRGQENCGSMFWCQATGFHGPCKIDGLVHQLFSKDFVQEILKLKPTGGIGHNRYATAGGTGRDFAQPWRAKVTSDGVRITSGYAGNGDDACLVEDLEELEREGVIIDSAWDGGGNRIIPNDGEVIQRKILHFASANGWNFPNAIKRLMETTEASYSSLMFVNGNLMAFRDPRGFHPVCYGHSEEKPHNWFVASESCAFQGSDIRVEEEVKPGELVIFRPRGDIKKIQLVTPFPLLSLCFFEFVYFMRPDSRIFGNGRKELFAVRYEHGRQLAREHPVPRENTIVIDIPDSGTPHAEGFAKEMRLPRKMLFSKNRFLPKGVSRIFQIAGQKEREKYVRMKYSINPSLLDAMIEKIRQGEIKPPFRIVVVDDSIVRLTTLLVIIQMIRETWVEYGGKLEDLEIYIRIPSPRIIAPCYYGIDIPTFGELVAAGNTNEQIARKLGSCVVSVEYLSIEGLLSVLDSFIEPFGVKGFCTGCITKNYPTKVGRRAVTQP